MTERLSQMDATFLYLEEPDLHMHVGGLAVFDPSGSPRGAIGLDRLRAITAARIASVPRFRQRVLFPPFDVARPVWAEDPGIDIEYHVRRVAVPRPGGPRQLAALTAQLHSQQLDRTRPLWEMYLVEGLEDGHQALLTKTHHAILDGAGGMDAAASLLDLSPEPANPVPQPWNPPDLPSPLQLFADGVAGGMVERTGAVVRGARDLVVRPRRVAGDLLGVAGGAASFLARGLPPTTPLDGRVGPTRRFATTEIPLEDAKAVKRALGGTVNDVILSVVAGAVSRLLEGRGESGGGRYRTMMPISLRTGSQPGGTGNRVTTVYPDLPVGPMSAKHRFRLVREETCRMKASSQGMAATALVQGSMWVPPAVHRAAARFGNRHVPIFNIVVSNIPGPQVPIYLDGMPLVAYYPLMPLGATSGLSVGIVTLVGVMGFGFSADWDLLPDLEALALGVDEEFRALQKAAER